MAPSVQAQAFVGNHQVQVEVHRIAEALAARAGAEGIVEAEQPRLRLAAGPVAVLALVGARKAQPPALLWPVFLARSLLEDHLARLAIGDLHGVHDARAVLRADHDAVQKHEHRQRKVQIEQRLRRRELEDLALLPEPVEAAGAQFGKRAFSVSVCGESAAASPPFGSCRALRRSRRASPLSASPPPAAGVALSYRKQHIQPRSLAQRQNRLGRLVHRIALHEPVAVTQCTVPQRA